jgi:hypothetical protein
VQAHIRAIEEQNVALERELRASQQANTQLQVEREQALEACKLKQKDTEALLEVRTAELRAAEESLGKPHAISHGDIHRLVERLNSEVYQMSALVTDHFPFSFKQSFLNLEAREPAYRKVACIVGPGLAHLVATSTHSDDPVLVQIMIQAYFVERVRWIVETWSHLTSPEYDLFLAHLHREIFEGGRENNCLSCVT